ncbi:homeobox-leucine zipper protein HAT14-like [Arachis stenosperma]|uniref:homeobox-leucine zipper protein HAT14-like n=1 Tax=Arachis stenosperma TaxID=217475 RepID=UPI0025ACE12E|nr:homeobox-leucine zipper protein HAT14-like [Arachis stenosperma]
MMMAFSNNNDQELGLGLGLGLVHGENCRQKKEKEEEDPCSNIKAYPSLTLGPEQDSRSSQSAVVSSFSNSSSSIKRERDQEFFLDLYEEENKKNNNKNGNPRKKLRLTKQQSALLEDSFIHHSTLNPKQKQELAKKLNLRARQVEVWFQNRRARTKLKQTEAECEILKKWRERLREENKRLQKELQHLKSMKTNNK